MLSKSQGMESGVLRAHLVVYTPVGQLVPKVQGKVLFTFPSIFRKQKEFLPMITTARNLLSLLKPASLSPTQSSRCITWVLPMVIQDSSAL